MTNIYYAQLNCHLLKLAMASFNIFIFIFSKDSQLHDRDYLHQNNCYLLKIAVVSLNIISIFQREQSHDKYCFRSQIHFYGYLGYFWQIQSKVATLCIFCHWQKNLKGQFCKIWGQNPLSPCVFLALFYLHVNNFHLLKIEIVLLIIIHLFIIIYFVHLKKIQLHNPELNLNADMAAEVLKGWRPKAITHWHTLHVKINISIIHPYVYNYSHNYSFNFCLLKIAVVHINNCNLMKMNYYLLNGSNDINVYKLLSEEGTT